MAKAFNPRGMCDAAAACTYFDSHPFAFIFRTVFSFRYYILREEDEVVCGMNGLRGDETANGAIFSVLLLLVGLRELPFSAWQLGWVGEKREERAKKKIFG